MTGEEIITHFQWLTDDESIDETQLLVLANETYDFVCASEFWHFLYASESSQTIVAADTTYALPADFLFTHKITLRRSASSDEKVECEPVPYKDRLNFLGDSRKYYVDQKNSSIVFCADPVQYAGWLLVHDYQYQPAQITTATSPVFNRAFHSILAYDMAKKYYYNDQGEKQRSWNSEMEFERKRLLDGLRSWDGINRHHSQPSGSGYNWIPELSR